MAADDEEKPWAKRLRQLREHHDAQRDEAVPGAGGQQQQAAHAQQRERAPPAGDDQPTELQQQLLAWYRSTCLVAGAALVGSVWQWNFGGKSKSVEVFVPPRAQSLPAEVVEGWKRSMRFKEGVRTVGRQTVFATGIAALYFGVELGAARWRGAEDWANAAAAGGAAGGYLGSLLPGASRGRGAALGAAAGAALGGAAGAARGRLLAMLPPDPRQGGGGDGGAAVGPGWDAGADGGGGGDGQQRLVGSRPP
ncbi:MAG: hypothetical protein J3K34DRAFT_519120 [Monoraphidium minutum]|nr:MAG: hypothetical protein J3K34DRAFT_519120 [Monoraphidium minutum]